MFSVFPYIFSFNDIIIHFTEFSNKCQTNPVCFRKFFGKIKHLILILNENQKAN